MPRGRPRNKPSEPSAAQPESGAKDGEGKNTRLVEESPWNKRDETVRGIRERKEPKFGRKAFNEQ